MPYILTHEYDVDLMSLNPELHQVYIESVSQAGGERRIVYLRMNEKGLPLTLRENYTEKGTLSADTYERDARQLENQLLKISRLSYSGVNVCVPVAPLTRELDVIQKQSPKLAGYLKQRLASINLIV